VPKRRGSLRGPWLSIVGRDAAVRLVPVALSLDFCSSTWVESLAVLELPRGKRGASGTTRGIGTLVNSRSSSAVQLGTARARKVLGWPKRCKLAHAFL
jgi:hypothetical protein